MASDTRDLAGELSRERRKLEMAVAEACMAFHKSTGLNVTQVNVESRIISVARVNTRTNSYAVDEYDVKVQVEVL